MITHVVVGYSAGLLGDLDRHLPPGSVLVLEEPHVISARSAREQIARFGCVAELRAAPTQDEADPAGFVAAVPRPDAVRAVLPAVEYGVVAAAALAEAWGLPGAGGAAARVLRDKSLLRRAAAGAGIDQPDWVEVRSAADVAPARARFGGSCVLKPANRQASLGVQVLGPGDDPEAAWAHTTAAAEPRLWARSADQARFLVEQRVRGPEVSVEALVDHGVIGFVNVTAKSVQGSRYPVETGHVVPADLPPATLAAVRAATAALVSAVGFGSGVLHAEWILVDGVAHLVECAGRLPGDSIDLLIDLAYGGSILGALLEVLTGTGAAGARAPDGAAAIRFLSSPPGVVTAVDGVPAARACPGVRDVHVGVEVGQRLGAVTNSWQRAGYVIATGADPARAAATAEGAAGRVVIGTVPA